MSKAKNGDTVKVEYIGRLTDGTTFDSSEGGPPLEFVVGESKLIPGFEQAVEGMEVGDTRSTTIPSQEAYGDPRDDLKFDLPREQFPDHIDPQVGQRLQISQGDQAFVVQVTDVGDESVSLDANHPLAGQDLTFDITLVGIA